MMNKRKLHLKCTCRAQRTHSPIGHGLVLQADVGCGFGQAGKAMGLVGIEGIDTADYPAAKAAGLEISLVNSHGFVKGPVDPQHHAEVEKKLRESIDVAVKFDAKRVITFTGMRVANMRDETAKQNCLDSWKRVIGYAEQHKIMLCLEHLNSRDDSHPMKGHPGYFGDDVELCIELVKAMDSPYFRLLFDIYHVQIMNGDVIRRIRQYHPYIGHYHTAGNPGRGELDETQEINYPPIMRAIIETATLGSLPKSSSQRGKIPWPHCNTPSAYAIVNPWSA